MNPSDVLIAKAQIGLAYLFVIGIFALVFLMVFYHTEMTSTTLTIVGSVVASLITVLTLQQNYFFARQRPHPLPDPNTTTIEQTTTVKSSPTGGPPNVPIAPVPEPVIAPAAAMAPIAPVPVPNPVPPDTVGQPPTV